MSQPVRRSWCGTMPVHHRMLETVSGYAQTRTEIENFTRQGHVRLGAVVALPVVVHVVWHDAAQNISDEQIASQLAVLNADFRRTNPDVASVPAPWQPLVADARIEFALATTDPAGQPCTGVTRTHTDTAAFGTDDAVKSAATGGADAWPTDRYLNIWVCPLAGGLLGYAQFPGGPAETDGVVVLHSAFGTTGTAAAPFNGGRTLTHEIGHWLNLRHIWGDDGDGCAGSDYVADTPNQAGPNYGRPVWPKVSCGNGPDGDMFMNYMDYTDDAAMYMFTVGQAARMAACLAGPRAALASAAQADGQFGAGTVVSTTVTSASVTSTTVVSIAGVAAVDVAADDVAAVDVVTADTPTAGGPADPADPTDPDCGPAILNP